MPAQPEIPSLRCLAGGPKNESMNPLVAVEIYIVLYEPVDKLGARERSNAGNREGICRWQVLANEEVFRGCQEQGIRVIPGKLHLVPWLFSATFARHQCQAGWWSTCLLQPYFSGI